MRTTSWTGTALLTLAGCLLAGSAMAQTAQPCATMRKINIGVSVSPPNVVHTSPYVAKELGIFAKHCIDATIIQFDGGGSPAAGGSGACVKAGLGHGRRSDT